ncbi:MAG TPA: alcohol dehydrogenase catalytic domain-containing protein [Vicinamibacterales bacterium]|nr:alcohol dehydrogenase catalytic domain-containing protein [Vicinamibacterales bacterium]
MTRMMRAAVLTDVARMELQTVPVRPPGAHDVLVRVRAVGLCGTDFHIFAGHGNYNTDERGVPIPLRTAPQILGHEIVGVVEERGRDVTDLAPGDQVIVDQGINCVSARRAERCEYCATGDSHQCAFYAEHGITGLPGGLAEFITVPAVNAVRTDPALPASEAALSEPLGCIVHASETAARAGGRYALKHEDPARRVHHVLVYGAGPSGLLFVQYLRHGLGWDGPILVSEPNAKKRELAVRFGAEALDPDVDIVDAVNERTDGRRVEYVIDASGAAEVFRQLPGVLRKQGTVLLYGHGHAGADLSLLNNVQFLEPTLVSPVGASGGFLPDGRPATYVRALSLIQRKRIQAQPLLTHRYTALDEVPAAFGGDHRRPDYVKGVVLLDGAGP